MFSLYVINPSCPPPIYMFTTQFIINQAQVDSHLFGAKNVGNKVAAN
jgi:hypothetical protein